jgi:DNA helicase IV
VSKQEAAEVAREQELVDTALARLEVLRAETSLAEEQGLRGGGGTPQAVYERDVTVLHFAARRVVLDAAADGLVFGRLDREDGTVHHIGRIGVRTEEQHPLVVDWRAPAAAAFYRATAAQPDDVVRRRTITSRGVRVVAVEDELLDPARADQLVGTTVVGDGAFLAALSKERTGRMRDIVATIQREQDEAVRAPDDGVLLVTGGPGTGKTAVALHRVAFLMYTHRERFSRRGVLVVGPSPVFVDYVSQVLPTLGETSVRLVSLETLVPDVQAIERDTPAVAAVKGSLRMAEVLKRAARAAGRPRVEDASVVFRGRSVTVNGRDQSQRRAQIERSPRSHNSLHTQARTALANLVVRAWISAAGAQDWSDRAKDELREEAAFDLRENADFERAMDRFWPVLEPRQVFDELRSGSLRLPRGVLSEAEAQLLGRAWRGSAGLSPADAALLDELAELVGEPPAPPEPEDDEPVPDDYGEVTTYADRNSRSRRDLSADESHRDYAHVVVDEAQDVSPMQWRALGRRARSGTWTVVGDWAQSVWPDPAETQDAVTGVAGRRRVRRHELTTNYRTSTEIADLAAEVLALIDPDATPPAAVRSTGSVPVVRTGLTDLPQAVREAADEVLGQVTGTVGVIATVEDADALRAALTDPRLQVLDTWQAKGMEFDGCLVVAPERIAAESPAGLRSLYVALTRATQRLVVLTTADEPWGDVPAPPAPAVIEEAITLW